VVNIANVPQDQRERRKSLYVASRGKWRKGGSAGTQEVYDSLKALCRLSRQREEGDALLGSASRIDQ